MQRRGRPPAFDRERALRRAMRAFWERGYEATSISHLAGTMGINPPSLYAAFGDKESLFRSTLRLYGDNEGALARRALERDTSARVAVETLLRDAADRFTDPAYPAGCMIVLAATNCSERNDAVREFAAELRRHDEHLLRERLARAVETGELAPDVDPGQLAAYLHTILYGMSIQARDGATRERLHGIVDMALSHWPAPAGARHRAGRGPRREPV